MKDLQMKPAVNEVSVEGDAREEYTPPEIHDLGDVSAITQGIGCNSGVDASYS